MKQELPDTPLVLVVEDDADARDMYEILLGTAGLRVVSAGNGLEGIERARAERPQLILMDLSLPTIDGFEASRRLKGDPATRDIPIVALSGNPIDDPGRQKAFAATLLKPCLPDDLLAAVQRHVGQVPR